MGVNNSWRQPRTMDDWMRDVEKRLMHEERRPQNARVSDVVGSGIGTYSRRVEDWDLHGAVTNGFYYSVADQVTASPDDTKNWMGLVQVNSIGQGLQRVWEYIDDPVTPSPDPGLFTRSFVTNADGTRNFTPWLQGGGGGGVGTGEITVQDEGTTIASTVQLDFIGAGVTAIAGTGEVQLTIDGTPKGAAGGDLTGTYPNPTIGLLKVTTPSLADAAVTGVKIADATIGLAKLSATGTKDGTTFLRGDNTWAVPSAGGGAPTGPAGGDLTGTYPNPDIATGAVTPNEIQNNAVTWVKMAPDTKDQAVGVASMRTLGIGATQAAVGTHAHTGLAPGAHATTHQPGGSDPMAVDAVAATGSLRTLGTGAQQAAAGNDARLSDQRVPTDNSVTSAKIVDGTIVTADLADGAVTSVKIADGTVAPADLTTALQAQINGAAVDTAVVHKTGAETVAGIKSLSSPLTTAEQATKPATPASGWGEFYFKTDSLPYAQGDDGIERPLIRAVPAKHENPGFDGVWTSTAHGTEPPGWDEFWQVAAVTDTYDTTDFISGGGSCKITQPSTGATVNTRIQSRTVFGVQPGDVVTISVWAKTNLPSPFLRFDFMTGVTAANAQPFGGGNVQTRDLTITSTWALYTASFTIPPGDLFARISFVGQAIGAGDWWLDESGSEVVTPTPPAATWAKEPVRACAGITNVANPGTDTFDGVVLAINDRLLLPAQTTPAQNGIYLFKGSAVALVRAPDAATSADIAGAEVAVRSGTLYGGTRWDTAFKATDTLDTSNMYWVRAGGTSRTWTPTVTAETGTFTTVSTSGCRWTEVEGVIHWSVAIVMTTTGTATNGLRITLPPEAPIHNDWTNLGSARESQSTGWMCHVTKIGSTALQINKWDNTTIIGSSRTINASGSYLKA